jgi:O-antigen/teichoic acid export membrane protein
MAGNGTCLMSVKVRTLWAFGVEISAVVTSLVTVFLAIPTLGPGRFGELVGLYGVLTPLSVFVTGGPAMSLADRILRQRQNSMEVLHQTIGTAIVEALALAPCAFLAIVLLLRDLPWSTALIAIAVELFIAMISTILTWTIQAHGHFQHATKLRVFTNVGRGLGMAVLSILGVVSINTIMMSSGATLLIVVWLAYRKIKTEGLSVHLRNLSFRRASLGSSVSYALGVSASSMQSDGDKAALNGAGQQVIAGQYGLAYRVLSIAYMPIAAAISATHQSFLEQDGKSKPRFAMKSSAVALAYSVVAAAGLWITAPLLPRLVSQKFEPSVEMIRWLAIVLVPRSISAFPIGALMGLGRTRQRTTVLLISAALSLVLYGTLIPAYSWKGAVAASLIVEAFLVVTSWGCMFWSVKNQNRPPRARHARGGPFGNKPDPRHVRRAN